MKKVALVTGSRRGIGLGIAKALGQNGYFTIVSAVSSAEDAQPVMDELQAMGICAQYIRCDISKQEDRTTVFDRILQEHGRLDLLVNNAGVAPLERMDILSTTPESFDRLMNINLRGTFFMCQIGANCMIRLKEQGNLEDYQPRIINISSMSA